MWSRKDQTLNMSIHYLLVGHAVIRHDSKRYPMEIREAVPQAGGRQLEEARPHGNHHGQGEAAAGEAGCIHQSEAAVHQGAAEGGDYAQAHAGAHRGGLGAQVAD